MKFNNNGQNRLSVYQLLKRVLQIRQKKHFEIRETSLLRREFTSRFRRQAKARPDATSCGSPYCGEAAVHSIPELAGRSRRGVFSKRRTEPASVYLPEGIADGKCRKTVMREGSP